MTVVDMPQQTTHTSAAETMFAEVFAHLGLLTAYARRRGARDPDAIAAEAMAIAWRRLADVPRDDARPWLIAANPTTANPAWSSYEHRSPSRSRPRGQSGPGRHDQRRRAVCPDRRHPGRRTPGVEATAPAPAAPGHTGPGPDRGRRCA